MWHLKPGWLVDRWESGLEFFCDIRSFRIKLSPQDTAAFFRPGHFLFPSEPAYYTLAERLYSMGVLSPIDADYQEWGNSLQAKYFFHVGLDPKQSIKRLAKKTVLILGLGGTGSVILEHLAPTEIGEFILVDDDIVEKSNLQRQLIYNISSIGKLKIDCASTYISDRNSSAKIITFRYRIEDENTLNLLLDEIGKIDVCAVCIDHPPDKIFRIASTVLWGRGVPFIHGGVMPSSGFWGPFFSRQHGSPDPAMYAALDCSAKSGSKPCQTKVCFSPYNTIIAAQMAADILHFLSGAFPRIDFNHRTLINFENHLITKLLSN